MNKIEMEMNMSRKYIPLNCDDYIVGFGKDIFKISRFRELVVQEIREKLMRQTSNTQQQAQVTIIKLFKDMTIAEENLEINSIQFQFFQDCQLLTIGSKNWQTGKLKVQISISPQGKHADEIYIEFYPDDSDKLLPLDSLGNGSNNMKFSELY
ncbi:hypothetical protein H6G06_16240 [Anabaena sphaerica FACHB-251]|uniref:KGK family protein n=1 Tax=Anabaena sphaerica FACHB-251 TaxID=2692883 RepID=A0A926WJJ4_9NOST|nr:KGK domain-containing protein [Anabaena sphaerica]MBD2294989.1 hypothetical protein [Anabaena sphaerica FACHB-251]